MIHNSLSHAGLLSGTSSRQTIEYFSILQSTIFASADQTAKTYSQIRSAFDKFSLDRGRESDKA